jgi:23S rRNA (guanosine2251-2'-O)-methyltransferase
MDLIIGIHSIAAALKNKNRQPIELIATDEGLTEFLKKTKLQKKEISAEIKLLSPHLVQEEARALYREKNLDYQRVPGNIFLLSHELESFDPGWLRSKIENSEKIRILALDNISDVHNGAAILRTASFFGVDVVIIPQEKSFGLTPSFFRIASGATEFVPLVRTSNLTRTLTQMKEAGVEVWGLSEHSESSLTSEDLKKNKVCLVLGSEDEGLSNAVMRVVSSTLSLTSQGQIKSLNVSAAATLALQLCFPASED